MNAHWYETLQQRLAQRDTVLVMRGQVRNHQHAFEHNPAVVAQVRQRMHMLDQTIVDQIAHIEMELAVLVSTDEQEASKDGDVPVDWAMLRPLATLQTIPGIGLVTALCIVVATLNLTLCSSSEQAIASAGVARHGNRERVSTNARGVDCELLWIWQLSPLPALILSM